MKIANQTNEIYHGLSHGYCICIILCMCFFCSVHFLVVAMYTIKAYWSSLPLKPLQGDSESKQKALEAYFAMMASFLEDPAYYMAAYKRHQSSLQIKPIECFYYRLKPLGSFHRKAGLSAPMSSSSLAGES